MPNSDAPSTAYVEIRDHRHGGYFRIDNELIDDYLPLIGRTGLTVYCVLARYANRSEEAWPSLEHLAKLCKLKRRTVQETVHGLERLGLVKIEQMREHGRFTRNCYTLLEVHRKQSTPVAVKTVYGEDSGRSTVEYEQNQPDNSFTDPPCTVSTVVPFSADGSERPTNKTYLQDLKQDVENQKHTQTRARAQGEFPQTEAEDEHPGDHEGEDYCHARLDGACAWPLCAAERVPSEEPDEHGSRSFCPLPWIAGKSGQEKIDTMDTLQPVATPPAACERAGAPAVPEACRQYQPGFPCEHLLTALSMVANEWWGQPMAAKPQQFLHEFRSKEHLHVVVHEFTATQIRQAAQWWKGNRRPQDLSLPLFFSQITSTLANAQSGDSRDGETPWERWAREEREAQPGDD